jgi:hypothetical protein
VVDKGRGRRGRRGMAMDDFLSMEYKKLEVGIPSRSYLYSNLELGSMV